MREKLEAQYDSLYNNSEKIIFGSGAPIKSLLRIKKYLDSGVVLDIGGGDGRNALYLAKEGFSVTVTDISRVGLDKLTTEAKNNDLAITTLHSDITEDGIDGSFDLILFSFVLHHIKREDAITALSAAKEHTLPGGLILIATFGDTGELAERNNGKERFYTNETELNELFADWDIKELGTKETTTRARNKLGERMKNEMVVIIAQKPSN